VDRIVFSNLACIVGSFVNLGMAAVDVLHGYHVLLTLTMIYQGAIVLCVLLNFRQRYVAARVTLLSIVYAGFFLTGLLQGPALEIEHFFIPMGVLGFCMFYADERRYGFFFLGAAVAAFYFLVSQPGPTLHWDPAAGLYSTADRNANRIGYLALFVVCMLEIIDEQRQTLFEERRFALLGTVACNVAHEINSPLTALNLQLFQLEGLLKKNSFSREEAEDRISRMQKVSRRISVIVRGLKFLSRQEANDPMVRTEVSNLIDPILDLCRDRMVALGIHFVSKISCPKATVVGRPVALSQVVLNLMNNAIDAVAELHPTQRWIQLEAAIRNSFLEISVTDGGTIESADVREKLFKSFFTTKPAGKGMGLGLSISKETMEEHSGSLLFDVESKNTRFVVRMPLPKG
jgi:signal transduction histidine kinase